MTITEQLINEIYRLRELNFTPKKVRLGFGTFEELRFEVEPAINVTFDVNNVEFLGIPIEVIDSELYFLEVK